MRSVNIPNTRLLRLVAYRPGTTVNPILAGTRVAGQQSNRLPELGCGNPTLVL
ncbi:hypothetical protein [Amycolatopsis acidicola]|uniref:hypothetical protein n=1 Tax=Amycolatopsis acidicola TaxID=2596893 RepID=UPI00140C5AB9|nr:hypothetical protein [Amycolatopsis acidicola]